MTQAIEWTEITLTHPGTDTAFAYRYRIGDDGVVMVEVNNTYSLKWGLPTPHERELVIGRIIHRTTQLTQAIEALRSVQFCLNHNVCPTCGKQELDDHATDCAIGIVLQQHDASQQTAQEGA